MGTSACFYRISILRFIFKFPSIIRTGTECLLNENTLTIRKLISEQWKKYKQALLTTIFRKKCLFTNLIKKHSEKNNLLLEGLYVTEKFPPQFVSGHTICRGKRIMATRVSSFVKKDKSHGNKIPGTKVSLQNSQLLISSGIPSLDSVLGGGLPVGALILIDEDTYGTFSKIFMKYFVAEGILSTQALHVCSKDVDLKQFINELPGPCEYEGSSTDLEDDKNEEMKIAWRYQNMKLASSSFTSQQYIGHYFNLSKALDKSFIEKSDISHWTDNEYLESDESGKIYYASLLKSIRDKIEKGNYLMSAIPKERQILRLGLLQIGSPLWPASDKYLPTFLYGLRALLRNSFSTCMISVPFHLFEAKDLKSKCVHLSDICIQLESFSGTKFEENVALRDYNCFFRILKWAAINCLVNGGSPFVDLAIKLRKKKLVIEKLHLPPELEDTTQREQGGSMHLGCGSTKSTLLEF